MQLEQFFYIKEIAKCKSLSGAAKKLYIAQPSLSISMQKLEDELGFRIFTRSPRGVTLTEKGEKMLKAANAITGQIEKINDFKGKNEKQKIINISCVPAACTSLVMKLITDQKKENIGFSMNVEELRPDSILDSVMEKKSLIGIGSYMPATKERFFKIAHENGLFVEPLLEDRMAVFLSRNHPLSSKAGIHVHELESYTPILFSDFEVMDENYDESAVSHEISRNYYCFSNQGSMKEAISRGLGYAVLPYIMAVGDVFIDTGKIAAIPLLDCNVTFGLYICYYKSRILSYEEKWIIRKVREISEYLNGCVRDYWARYSNTGFSQSPSEKIYY